MKFAICMYGQPRDYKYGYGLISEFMKINNEHTYDFFFHAWINDNIVFDCSPWRQINPESLYIKNQNEVKNEILELYKPILYEFEKPLDKNNTDISIDLLNIKDSLVYKNMCQRNKDNIFNTLSQMYSRNKVKDLLQNIITKLDKNYDMVISTRFDGFNFPKKIKLNNIQKNKIYVSSLYHPPRFILPDNFLLIPIDIYLNWFNLYHNIKNIINNTDLENKMNNINETHAFNAEEILLSNYLYCGYSMNDIIFSSELN